MSDDQELDKMINDRWPSWLNVNKQILRDVGGFLLDSGLQTDEVLDQLERLCEAAVEEFAEEGDGK